jgi:putative methyltransferase (TIGR04325 family)
MFADQCRSQQAVALYVVGISHARLPRTKRWFSFRLLAFAKIHGVPRAMERIEQMMSFRRLAHSGLAISVHEFVRAFGSNCYGIYPDMLAARAAAPPHRIFGYDNRKAAELYLDSMGPHWGDYALIYWLQKTIRPRTIVFDLGGNIGQAFYIFEKYLCYPDEFRWIVCDLPASVEAGKRYLEQHPRRQLEFTASLDVCLTSDVLLAAGALQYLDWSLPEMLARAARRPQHVLINKTPAYEGPEYVTLQDIGPSIVAYRVFNRGTFVGAMSKAGYELLDYWEIEDLQCRVLFHPSRTVSAYSGMYFRLGASA